MGLDASLGLVRHAHEAGQECRGHEGGCQFIGLQNWRKNWNLHTYIVDHFAGGTEECIVEVELTSEQAEQVARDNPGDAQVFRQGITLLGEESGNSSLVYAGDY